MTTVRSIFAFMLVSKPVVGIIAACWLLACFNRTCSMSHVRPLHHQVLFRLFVAPVCCAELNLSNYSPFSLPLTRNQPLFGQTGARHDHDRRTSGGCKKGLERHVLSPKRAFFRQFSLRQYISYLCLGFLSSMPLLFPPERPRPPPSPSPSLPSHVLRRNRQRLRDRTGRASTFVLLLLLLSAFCIAAFSPQVTSFPPRAPSSSALSPQRLTPPPSARRFPFLLPPALPSLFPLFSALPDTAAANRAPLKQQQRRAAAAAAGEEAAAAAAAGEEAAAAARAVAKTAEDPWDGHKNGFDWQLERARRTLEGGPAHSPFRMDYWRPAPSEDGRRRRRRGERRRLVRLLQDLPQQCLPARDREQGPGRGARRGCGEV
ncbi:hypothetical protein Naga_100996g1 [Nannochloropsis gaditana]|uniref:Uncharacterized protein n=1 Tax=Nannochloropsis gaditana TaxID=72520 RepID=W7TI69_9STRA|nr:hypothetical protein Naga_100996g1 [Nannochloropsis gaditana]